LVAPIFASLPLRGDVRTGQTGTATFAKLRFLPADDQEATQRQAGAATILWDTIPPLQFGDW